ncbi:hypothetical protein K438DRAFT_448234 [Mycena galopus ATCC 62051]|nr:hypothetical protein K438DRAFT_448234 [Mycena galopus ATCC 62051]
MVIPSTSEGNSRSRAFYRRWDLLLIQYCSALTPLSTTHSSEPTISLVSETQETTTPTNNYCTTASVAYPQRRYAPSYAAEGGPVHNRGTAAVTAPARQEEQGGPQPSFEHFQVHPCYTPASPSHL